MKVRLMPYRRDRLAWYFHEKNGHLHFSIRRVKTVVKEKLVDII